LHENPVAHVPQAPASCPPLDEPLDEPELLPELEPLDELPPELLPELEPLLELPPELLPELEPLLEPLEDELPPSPGPPGLLPEPPHAATIMATRAQGKRYWTRMGLAYHEESPEGRACRYIGFLATEHRSAPSERSRG
jgi:hypothetical protein